MADKLQWLEKHLVLIRYVTVEDAIRGEGFKIRPDLEEIYSGVSSAEEMVFKLADAKDHKSACELMAYITHRRAGIWWGYKCALSLIEELNIAPPKVRDIEDITLKFKPDVPDFAKVKLPKVNPADIAKLKDTHAQMQALQKEMMSKVDPKIHKLLEDALDISFNEFKKEYGMTPIEVAQKLAMISPDIPPIDMNSPIFKAVDELKARMAAIRKETIDTIKSVIPPKVPAHEKKMRDNALEAVYRWVVSPDDLNSKLAMDAGNACVNLPAGLLALAAFWSFGNLMPTGEIVVPTPPGLAANGLAQFFLKCALEKGGTRKPKERFEHYFNLGVEVLSGRDNWESTLTGETSEHKRAEKLKEDMPHPAQTNYKRWTEPPKED
ncbi:MAG: hypothetical protein LBP51_07495 [Deferribacteraceae bacterium]|jgi:hypothetical protein|nr:hypothetical protein [Deferribacteraceae bacterium]